MNPRDIFPLKPYETQLEIMDKVSKFLGTDSPAKFGIFESPTGTGKSLTVLSAAFSWLLDEEDYKTEKEKKLPRWAFEHFDSSSDEDIDSENNKARSPPKKKMKTSQKFKRNSETPFCSKNDSKKQLFFLSRTHSQLVQIIEEFKKLNINKNLKVISVGSRKSLCINENVTKLGSVDKINDGCRRMLEEGRNNKSKKCPFNKDIEDFGKDLGSKIILSVNDVKRVGERSCICPYFGVRKLLPAADMVVAPYQSILHKKTREASDLDIKGSVVIIDEAHNLPESVGEIYSNSLSKVDTEEATEQLQKYLEKYSGRLKRENLSKLNLVKRYFGSVLRFLRKIEEDGKTIVTPLTEFEFKAGLNGINMYPLLEYIEENKITNKMIQFTKEDSNNPFGRVISFAETISKNLSQSARVTLKSNRNHSHNTGTFAKVWLIDLSGRLEDLVKDAKKVVLMGGTMKPFEVYTKLLFREKSLDKVKCLSWGHVANRDQLLCVTLKKGPSGHLFDFSFQKRKNEKMMEELGRALINFSRIIPKGMVCFFQSFDYLWNCVAFFKKTKIFDKISVLKKIFVEPKDQKETSKIQSKYNAEAKEKGSVLFCVFGGKLSEGIDFKDDLARSIVCVGVPFSDPFDLETSARISYLNTKGGLGQDFYYGMCLRKINQSIGRALRWKKDFAMVFLIDKKYSLDEKIKNGISGWIKERTLHSNTFGETIKEIPKFFRLNK